VLDTNVIVAARRSRAGASHALLRALDDGAFVMMVSVPLFLEYEAVLMRPEMLQALRLTEIEIAGFLDYLAALVEPVHLNYLWRPQLADVGDEMVLETAINGRADALVTFNARHFGAAGYFGMEIVSPRDALRKVLS
jgi:putative PIN family toxin of toxin-antitoxin system